MAFNWKNQNKLLKTHWGSWPPEWPAIVPLPPGIFSCVVPSTLYQGWSVWPVEHSRSDGMSLLRLGYKRHCSFCLGFSLSWIIHLGKASCHVMSSPVKRPRYWAIEASCLQPCKWIWKQILHPSQGFKWLWLQVTSWLQPPEIPWARTVSLEMMWDDEQLYKSLSIGLIFYATVDT